MFAGRLPAPAVHNAATQPQAGDDEDRCEICSVLHHLTAAPVELFAAPLPPPVAAVTRRSEASATAEAPALAFRARAPPLA
jgi:hypothetical protein